MDRLDLHARVLRNIKHMQSKLGLTVNVLTNFPAIFSIEELQELEAATREAAIGSMELHNKVSAAHDAVNPDTWVEDTSYFFGAKETDAE